MSEAGSTRIGWFISGSSSALHPRNDQISVDSTPPPYFIYLSSNSLRFLAFHDTPLFISPSTEFECMNGLVFIAS